MIGHENSLDALDHKNLWFQAIHDVKLVNDITVVGYQFSHSSKVVNHSPKELILKSKILSSSLK